MCGTLLDLPVELQSMVFGFLPDLDDALYLSHTCRPLHCLYATHKPLIERQIITSSPVYEYDLCLSKFAEANEDLAEIFKQHPNGVPPEKRPRGSIYLECVNTKWTDRTLTGEEVERIAARWRQFSILRDLYRDQSMWGEFESYRAQFASNLNVEARAVIVEPGVTEPGSFCLQLPPNSLAYSEFKARFYKTLCLHSIATSSLIFAKATIDQLRNDSHPPNLVGNIIANTTFGAWAKEMIVVGGEPIKPSQNDVLWSLEVFDFLYVFLLKKVIPLTKLDSWIHEQLKQWPYERSWYGDDPDERILEDNIGSWNLFIADCRWVLQPSDLLLWIPYTQAPPQ